VSFALLITLCLLAGPALALVLLFIGCAPPWQILGVMCGHNAYVSLIVFTLVVWLALIVIFAVIHVRRMFQ
jgi:hypothetical protein